MKTIKLICKEDELEKKLLPQLVGKVFHVTNLEGFKGIQKSQAIEVNKDEKFYYRHGQSQKSYGIKRGYICLVDLRNQKINDATLKDALTRYYFLSPHDKKEEFFFVLKPHLCPKLVSWKKANKDVKYKEVWVPYIECWYPENIKLEEIEEIIEVEQTPQKIINDGSYTSQILIECQKEKFMDLSK